MSSLRMRALEYIAANGNHMPYQDIASGLGENPQRVRGALGDASKEGYLSFGRDDISGQGGYSLTAKGKARIVNGHQTINGKQASENKKACDEREAAAHVMSAPPAIEMVITEPDPSLLAAANKVLFDENQKLQKRVEVLETSRENQRKVIADKTERIAVLEMDVAELQDCTADELVGTVARLMEENAALRKQAADARDALEDAQRGLMSGATLANSALMKKPSGYTFVFDDDQFSTYETEAEARQSAEFNLPEINYKKVHLVAVLDTAELAVKWARP